MRVAIVHDWLTDYGGAEKVLEQFLVLFPQAKLFTLLDFLPEGNRGFLRGKDISTSFIQRLPRAKSSYRSYLALMPLAVEQFDLSDFDLILSSSYAVAKGVISGPDQVHVCYCHSPIRYAWDLQHQYLRESGYSSGLKGWMARFILSYIRIWDVRTSNGVDKFVANSSFIKRRVKKVYGRDSIVIYPPVALPDFRVDRVIGDFYVTASRLVPYKRVDLIVKAFSSMPDKKLVVLGGGPMLEEIRRLAGNNVTVLGYQPDDVLDDFLRRAKAFVFAAEEDFGIAPVDAQARGVPVIAYGKGGVRDSVVDGVTGIFFGEQSVDSIVAAVNSFEVDANKFDSHAIRLNAERFSSEAFRNSIMKVVNDALGCQK